MAAPSYPIPPPAATGHEAALAARGERKARGSYYTPPDVAEALVGLTLAPLVARALEVGPDAVAALRVVDPACGAGHVLVPAARLVADALVGAGWGHGRAWSVAAGCVFGVDLDPAAARLCRRALREASGGRLGAREVSGRVVVADALADPAPRGLVAGASDAVVGNPPFLNQLGSATARGEAEATRLRTRFGPVVSAYTDPAAVFLLLGTELARPDGGVVGLIEPVSFLSGRDAGGARRVALERAALHDLWVVGERVFDAAVEVCVPVLVRGGSSGSSTHLWRGRVPGSAGRSAAPRPADRSWSAVLAGASGVPTVRRRLRVDGLLGDVATATADFRDEYYGLAPHVVDRAEVDDEAAWPPLVTSGLIDPGRCRWGERTTRFNKVTYLHPRVDRAALPPGLGAWATARLVPKVLVATQTRVPEAVVDPTGRLLPSVPVITVTALGADPAGLWRIAAVLGAPAIALEVARRHLGSGLNARSVRLRAADVLRLPTPADREAWEAAAAILRSGGGPIDAAAAMNRAYGLGAAPGLVRWWRDLLPAAAAEPGPRPSGPPVA